MQPDFLFNLIGFSGLLSIISLSFILMLKVDQLKQLQESVGKLETALHEMDEQAKLVVRTDMELNKTQEELAKKISGLYALNKLSRVISMTLEENQIFKKLDPAYLEDMGFTKNLILIWNEKENGFIVHLNIGYNDDQLKDIKAFIVANKNLCLNLIKEEKAFSSISKTQDSPVKERITRVFGVTYFIISPILPKEGSKGILFAGMEGTDTNLTQGDEELVAVLANQLGQSLENARLFEKTWLAQQDLEKKVEERTRALTLALEEVRMISRRKTDFVSSVTHELRTPLTSIKGYASILLNEKLGALPEQVKLRLEKINHHSDELAQFVNDLLDISRIESGRVSMKQEPHSLKQIAEEIADMLSPLLKERHIELACNIAEDAQTVFVDYAQIKRVFINLVNNAMKFTPADGKITIQNHKSGEFVQVDISDTGCGIPEDDQEKIFEEFYRVDNAINQQVKGTGLGLALVKNIIEAHKGKVWVKSKVGTGSTFSFTLPRATG